VTPYTVALVLDPAFGERLKSLAARVHAWVVRTPANETVAQELWSSQSKTSPPSIETGVTTFETEGLSSPEEWCIDVLDTLDLHHNNYSHHPGYSVLEVYGLKFHDRLKAPFAQLGFTTFENTDYGFRATKPTP
jgi:hypothetical protein